VAVCISRKHSAAHVESTAAALTDTRSRGWDRSHSAAGPKARCIGSSRGHILHGRNPSLCRGRIGESEAATMGYVSKCRLQSGKTRTPLATRCGDQKLSVPYLRKHGYLRTRDLLRHRATLSERTRRLSLNSCRPNLEMSRFISKRQVRGQVRIFRVCILELLLYIRQRRSTHIVHFFLSR
jgi:hypothetical protein